MSYQQPPSPYGQQPAQQYGATTGTVADPGTLDLPYYGIGFVDAVKRFFAKYARFDGRASRSEYWWAALGLIAITLVFYIPMVVGAAAQSTALMVIFGLLLLAFSLATIVPSIAIAVRRLHDAGFSGWMYLLGLIPFVGGIIVLVLMCMPSKPEGAKYDRGGAGYGQPGYGQPGY